MKKAFLAAALTIPLATQVFAVETNVPEEVHTPEISAHHGTESKYYVIAKALMVLGNTVDHGEAVLDGDRDYGYGFDIGYRLGNGFALEYDFSYARNTVTETAHGHTEEARGTYYTSSFDVVYTYEMTHNFGIFAKAGYEYEWEEIAAFDIDTTDDGFIVGAGVETAINESYKFIVEYEHSTIEGPRGDSLFAGVMYSF
ncbi:MAG TPA: porin family protein [Sulfurovum sp.]|uniref:porin family protein n=1 Tax=Sulfurovum sp. TaxID=1969726 RepID=UPI002F941155